ncbi:MULTISPECIES: AAA domain-containing protein [unclassified Amycolatopsis]|uniref:AAA domain-containing protein n=1 Tax=unclassified Amycolatopsis TaxID=2618356 RepID=UPI00106E65E8|nr:MULTISPECIES: AAA domain-containing protein [unclassified Amycolatopsis]
MDTSLVDRARRLFEFLRGAQHLKASPVRTTDTYQRDGDVVWLSQAPRHPAVSVRTAEPGDPDGPVLAIERVPVVPAPEPDADLARWLSSPLDDPEQAPALRKRIVETPAEDWALDQEGPGAERAPEYLSLNDFPSVEAAFPSWLARWQRWADQELVDRPARDLYQRLYLMYVRATESPEELELLAGTGCLSWQPVNSPRIRRHALTSEVSIHFDDRTGVIEVRTVESAEPARLELDMVDLRLITTPDKVTEVREDVKAHDGSALDRAAAREFVQRIVHSIDPDGEYRDEDEAAVPARNAVATFAPAVILRKRTFHGLIEIFDAILRQIEETGEVPAGLVPLLDPDYVPVAEQAGDAGAILAVDDEPFLPMPVNEKQLEVIRRVDSSSQVLVQGPPGTGKTHTAAALISHLLAQGKRVLVTAQTDRALREVRDKLPEQIKPLAVAVVGTSREDMADLKIAVQEIAAAAGDHDGAENARAVQRNLDAVDRLSRERSALHSRLIEAREAEVRERTHQGYRGTLSRIAQQLAAEEELSWLSMLDTIAPDAPVPLSAAEVRSWHRDLLDDQLLADEAESRLRLLALDSVSDAAAFANLAARERAAFEADSRYAPLKQHPAFGAVLRLAPQQRAELRQRLQHIADETDQLVSRREQWLDAALRDVRSGRADQWRARAGTIAGLVEACARPVAHLGALTEVVVREGDLGTLATLAGEVARYLGDGGVIKTQADGTPKIGAFAGKVLKQAQPLFERVRVDGVPPTSSAQLQTFLAWAEGMRVLAALDRAWPEDVEIPPEDTLQERLQWHTTELAQLQHVLTLADLLVQEENQLRWLQLPVPNWQDLSDVRRYANLADACGAEEARVAATQPLSDLEAVLRETAQWTDAAPCVADLMSGAKTRDHELYASARQRLERLWEVRQRIARRDHVSSVLGTAAPGFRAAVEADPGAPFWQERVNRFQEAWSWAATRAWVVDQEAIDVNDVQRRISRIEADIRKEAEAVAARRAWDHAASPSRLTGTARADLTQYAQLVQRAGKNTGIYRNQRRAEIRKAMDRCRPSVPVWIMPIYRIAEQLRVRPDMFDVVVIDEASQAGTEAVFLQYLARKIVVIGDDKQVSPSAVGTDQQELRDLARQYLADDRYRDSWHDPKRSLFDEAKMRYGRPITLVEHRRCVPEIIGFSNRIAYEPDGIRLLPVRQYGADRLDPVKAVYLEDGYERGATNKINPVEADAIVEQIEKCLSDPAYDGKTFGVVSLLGKAQAKRIEDELLARLSREDWQSRDLRCGDAADFQGSERDVIFLSMVAAPDPERRMIALTQDQYVQRFNVAVSRAKDQVWVFHSVRQDELPNSECMRYQLLDYCYGLRDQPAGATGRSSAVPDNERVEPFDSLFEQRVYNRVVARGYTVEPQFEALGYRIDLVVVGGRARLAVECDGDRWHGPDVYERDLARQRDLERCGWRFFRISGSSFDVDPDEALAQLWEILNEEEIYPAGWSPARTAPAPMPETPAQEPASSPQETAAVAAVVAVEEEFRPATGELVLEPEPSEPGFASTAGALSSYTTFAGALIPTSEASRKQMTEGVLAIVQAEGPVLGQRVHRAYVEAAKGSRVGRLIANELDAVLTQAVRRGDLLVDNPTEQGRIKERTYHLPDQPRVRIRELGPRQLSDVPPRELASLLAAVAESEGWDERILYRAVLAELGLKTLTKRVQELFDSIAPLARRIAEGE